VQLQANAWHSGKEALMNSMPPAAEPLLHEFAGAFTRPTYSRFLILLLAAILTTGRRTISNLLRTVQRLAPGHPSSDHRGLSRRRWFAARSAAGPARRAASCPRLSRW